VFLINIKLACPQHCHATQVKTPRSGAVLDDDQLDV